MDRTSKRLTRAFVLNSSIDFMAQVNNEQQKDQWKTFKRCQRVEEQQYGLQDDKTETPLAIVPQVPPPDRGSRAILFMVSAFIIEAIMWGFPLTSAGVFTTYYNSQPPFQNDRFIAVIATLGTGIPFLGAPIITPLTRRWHEYRQEMIWAGWVTCVGSLVAASFSTTVWQLIISQGLGYGVGFLILYYAMLDMLNEWFVERRGLAYGVLFAAAGLSGTGLPFLTEFLLSKFGYAWTLRVYAISMLVVIGPTLPFCRGRLPTISKQERKDHKIAYGEIFRNPIFYFFTISNLFQGLAFYLPGIYLSLYAWSLSIPTFPSILLLCLLNLAQVIGQVASGYLSDTSSIFVLLTISTLGSALACILWFFASNLVLLAVFAGLYGVFAGGYSVFFSRFVSSLTHDPSTSLWLYGIFAFQRGLGNVAAGPLSALLLEKMVHQPVSDMPAMNAPMTMPMGNSSMVTIMEENQIALSLGFRKLIIFVGGGLLLATFGGFGFFFRQHVLAPLGSVKEENLEMILLKEPASPGLSPYSSEEKRNPIWIKEKTISIVTERPVAPNWDNTGSDWT